VIFIFEQVVLVGDDKRTELLGWR